MNSIYYLYLITPLLALVISLFLFPVLRKFAYIVDLVDIPNNRKQHVNSIPLVGGIGVFIAVNLAMLVSLLLDHSLQSLETMFVITLILLIMGVIDDKKDLRASLKLAVQLLLAHWVYSSGIRIESLFGFFGVYELAPWIQYLLTVVVVAGVVNAFNLMDGIDGLAAGMALVGFAVFAAIAYLIGESKLTLVFLTFIGALIGFLRYNLSKKKKIFMGDAGSLVIGFVLVVSGIQLMQSSQGSSHILTVMLGVVGVLLIPVLDAVRVFRNRIKEGKSPFRADRNHLHHLVLALGIKHNRASLLIVAIAILLLVFGLLAFHIAGLTIAFTLMLFVFYFITAFLQFNKTMETWKQRIKKMENGED